MSDEAPKKAIDWEKIKTLREHYAALEARLPVLIEAVEKADEILQNTGSDLRRIQGQIDDLMQFEEDLPRRRRGRGRRRKRGRDRDDEEDELDF